MGILKETYVRLKEEYKERQIANEELRKKVKVAYNKAREEETIKLAKTKAKLERQKRERELKAKYAPKKPMNLDLGLSNNNFFGNPLAISTEPYFKQEPIKKVVK